MTKFPEGLVLLVVALAVHGQAVGPPRVDIAPPPSARFPASWYPPDNSVSYTEAPQTGAPYLATLVTTFRFVNPETGKMEAISRSTTQARDAAGRERDEVVTPRSDSRGKVVMVREVSVNDPVTHCSFQWAEPWAAPGQPTAIVTCMPRTVNFINRNAYADSIVTEEKEIRSPTTVDRFKPLGKQTFGDLEAVGTRHTKTVTNSQTGGKEELIIETWYSPDLKELLVMKEIPDPESNEKIGQIPDFELTDIHRVEPNAALFYPPDGYQIKSANSQR